MGNELNSANEQQGLGVAVLVLVLIISPVIIFLVRSATITIQVRGFWGLVKHFFATGLLLEPGPQGVRAEHGKEEGGQASISGGFLLLFLPTFLLPCCLSFFQPFSQMLPPTVAQALQLKKAVTAETYESVTVLAILIVMLGNTSRKKNVFFRALPE